LELVCGRKPTYPETAAFAEELEKVTGTDIATLSAMQYFRNVATSLAEVREAAWRRRGWMRNVGMMDRGR
jgi:hypothetical protein